jgi:hypothetical protein
LVGVQVDVTDHPTEAQAAPVGMQAAGVVGAALQNMNWCAEPAEHSTALQECLLLPASVSCLLACLACVNVLAGVMLQPTTRF